MDKRIHSIEKLLFSLLKRHTAFQEQFSLGVNRRFCGRKFAPSGDKPPPANALYAIGLLNTSFLRAVDFVPDYKVNRLFFMSNPRRTGISWLLIQRRQRWCSVFS